MPKQKPLAATALAITTTARAATIGLLLVALSISGCVWNPAHRAEQRAAEIDALRNRADTEPTIPVPPQADGQTPRVEMDVKTKTPGPEPEDALPTIPVRDFDMGREADLAVVLRALARGAGINLVLGQGVTGSVLINLPKETNWDQLFKMIVETHGLHYEFDDGLLRVLGPADIERQIALQEALKEREVAREERQRAEPLQFELYRVRYADMAQLAASLQAAFAPVSEETGETPEASSLSLIPDADSGLLIIHAPPSRMPHILELARRLDQPAYQILIEATIVQATSETARQLGMRWGLQHTAPDGGNVTIGTAANPDGFNSNFPAQFDPLETGFTFGIERLSEHQLLQAQLSALQREGRLSIVSSPSITTLDKQTAVLESGEERPFQSAAGTGVSATPTVEFKEALLSLEVTPQVIDGDWIKLKIKTTKDDFDDSRAVLIDGTLQVPITTRLASTTLYLTDGQTTVIGGLTTDTETDQVEGIPYLKDIPFLGGLFRSTNLRNSLSDTLIFITPHIISKGVSQEFILEEEPLP